jgi:MOSC domain-containing protein YiiM
MIVDKLFIKKQKGVALKEVKELRVNKQGIVGGVESLPTRHVLLLPKSVLSNFNLKAGDLRENIILDGYDIHSLPSGTVIKLGNVEIRLTYHCEPCKRLKGIVSLKEILHQRGYLGTILNIGTISKGDPLIILDKQFETIPYDIKERIKWYLDKQTKPVTTKKLVYDIGLSNSYCRAIPNMLKKMDYKYSELVLYPSKKTTQQMLIFDK